MIRIPKREQAAAGRITYPSRRMVILIERVIILIVGLRLDGIAVLKLSP